jgi:hypothetical protein
LSDSQVKMIMEIGEEEQSDKDAAKQVGQDGRGV